MKLYQAAQDSELMSELKEYFMTVLRERAIEKIFDTGHAPDVKEAKEVLDLVFENIELQFGKRSNPKEPNNESR